ncbi:MAG: hypothetical protein KDD60_07395, partial [Bdellovibrionales bacterium]|nr:hypothetical protein [Bdellovibrionales bacterium]
LSELIGVLYMSKTEIKLEPELAPTLPPSPSQVTSRDEHTSYSHDTSPESVGTDSLQTVMEARAKRAIHTEADEELHSTLALHRRALELTRSLSPELIQRTTSTRGDFALGKSSSEGLQHSDKAIPLTQEKRERSLIRKTLVDFFRSSNPGDTIIEDLVNALTDFLKKLEGAFTRDGDHQLDLDLEDPNKEPALKVIRKRKKKGSSLEPTSGTSAESSVKTGFYNIDSAREEEYTDEPEAP